MSKPILCLDFDGVIHSYASGWLGATVIPDPPVPGAMRFIWDAARHFRVVILSSRSHARGGRLAMKRWLAKHFREHWAADRTTADDILDEIEWPTHKPPALVTIDDRAICFDGDWSALKPAELLAFKPWNKRGGMIALRASNDALTAAQGREKAQAAEIERLRGWMLKAADQFGFYAGQHSAKGDVGKMKAAVNGAWASELRLAAEPGGDSPTPPQPDLPPAAPEAEDRHVIGIESLRAALRQNDLSTAKVLVQVAIDFLTNDEAALAEGRTFADLPPADQTEEGA